MEYAPTAPEGCTAGDIKSTELMSRVVGNSSINDCEKFVATCDVFISGSTARPTTLTVSVTDAGPNRASTGSVCVGASVTVFVTRSNPLSSKEIVYVPDGNSGNTKSPFSVVTTVRTPCRLGDAASTVTPGRASPC